MLNIVCALQCEAKPLINRFKLKADQQSALFPLYRSETTQLIISGIGKVNAAAATTYLMAHVPRAQTPAWLNIGVGGHKARDIGEGFLGNKITDRSTGHRYYPGVAAIPRTQTLPIETVDRPENNYPENAIVDMEASGFFPIASRLSPVEAIHCYKVISDNFHHSTAGVNKKFVTDLVENKIEKVILIIEALKELSSTLNQLSQPHQELDILLEKWHFTQTQRVVLETLLQRWKALNGDLTVIDNAMEQLSKSREVLEYLENKINSQPFTF